MKKVKSAIFIFFGCSLLLMSTGTARADSKVQSQAYSCPPEMVLVASQSSNIKICVDKYESSATGGLAGVKPAANQNYYSCQKMCTSKGKRLLSHKEWQVSCSGTVPERCNKYRSHPVVRKAGNSESWKFQGKDCKEGKNTWGSCLQDPSLNEQSESLATNELFEQCVSKYGVVNMVGNLGEWVSDIEVKGGREFGRFNGGLYAQKRSSCNYTTTAHAPGYSDYSLGCRCAQDLES